MLFRIVLICITTVFISSLVLNESYSVLYTNSDSVFFTLEWFSKFLYVIILCITLFAIIIYVHKCFQSKVTPNLYYSDIEFYQTIITAAPILTQCYIPTLMWGHYGHIQTIIFALWGRFNCPNVRGNRVMLKLSDGATLSYDIFQSKTETSKEDIMFFVAPGFANNAETDYIRTFLQFVTNRGYRCAVLNHIGTLPEVPVTSPRIFSFGNTNDLHEAVTDYIAKYPKSKVILFGYSLGGNLVPKYLGEDRERSSNIIAGFSICSLLDANRAVNGSDQWRICRWFYQYFLARTIKKIIRCHQDILLSKEVVLRHNLDVDTIFNAMSLVKIDEAYTRRLYNFNTLEDYYNWSSAINYLNGIRVPMIFINCLDDPLLSDVLHSPVRKFATRKNKVIAIELKYGGHLGFFENNCFISESITWLEKALIQLAEAIFKDNRIEEELKNK